MPATLQPPPAHLPAIRRWLTSVIVLVVVMVTIGGVTRLTESGLSIVEWKLVSGTLPPLNDEAWAREFKAYQATPQFRQVNADFTLHDFKRIYWLEYLHRLLGRIIGLIMVFGTVYFGARRRLPRALLGRMVGICFLVAAQGTVGWVMVASGLHQEPRVAPLKLAAHLLLAFALFALLLWTRWQVVGLDRPPSPRKLAYGARALFAVLALQLFFGALVAGLRAGLSYNTYPRMDGAFIPPELNALTPWWRNMVESVLTVQFQHRMGALLVVAATIALVGYAWKYQSMRPLLKMLFVAVSLQFLLGVTTLLTGVNLPVASAHQLTALFLVGIMTRLVYRLPLTAESTLR